MILLISLLLICHYLADFTPLSTTWMLKAKQFGKPLHPIMAHAGVHAGLMCIVLLFYTSPVEAFKLALLQLVIHFTIDTWKGRMNEWFPVLQDNTKKGYWMIFGFDQLLHQFTILLMVYCLKINIFGSN
jgi:hypothetical protein